MSDPAPVPVVDPKPAPVGIVIPPPVPAATAPATVRLAVREWWTTFNPSIDGVPVISPEGTEVPADKVAAVIEAGRIAGVTVVELGGK